MRLQFPALFRSSRPAHRWSLALTLLFVGIAASATGAETPPPAPGQPPRMLLLDGARVGDTIIAVGERGTILRSSDGATSWQRLRSPTAATLTGVSFVTRSTDPARRGWAAGHDAVILASDDAGRSWNVQFQGENLQESFLDVLALNEQSAIAVGAYGLYLSTADGGRTWVRRRLGPEDSHFNRITSGPAGTLYLAGEAGTLLRSSDQGSTWIPLRAPYQGSFYGILPLDERTLLAHGLRGRIFRSGDDGATWEEIAAPAPALLATGLLLPNRDLVLAGQARTLLVSRDHGKTVRAAARPLDTAVAELVALPDGRLLALGEAGATVIPPP